MDRLAEPDGPTMTFDVASSDGNAVVTVRGELDISNVDQLEAAVAPILETKPDRLIVDLGGLRFADSSAIAVWVRWGTTVGQIELCNTSPLLRQVITRMGLATRLRITE
jgi:anti-anti-sigma factor